MCPRFVPLSVSLWRVFIALQMLIYVNVYITNWTAFKLPPFAFQLLIHFNWTYACFITNVGLVMSGGFTGWLGIMHQNPCSCSIHTGLSFILLHVSVLRFENCTAGSLLVLLGWTINVSVWRHDKVSTGVRRGCINYLSIWGQGRVGQGRADNTIFACVISAPAYFAHPNF